MSLRHRLLQRRLRLLRKYRREPLCHISSCDIGGERRHLADDALKPQNRRHARRGSRNSACGDNSGAQAALTELVAASGSAVKPARQKRRRLEALQKRFGYLAGDPRQKLRADTLQKSISRSDLSAVVACPPMRQAATSGTTRNAARAAMATAIQRLCSGGRLSSQLLQFLARRNFQRAAFVLVGQKSPLKRKIASPSLKRFRFSRQGGAAVDFPPARAHYDYMKSH